jgi:microcin C transport system substrate-binding protein
MLMRAAIAGLLLVSGLSVGHAQEGEWRYATSLTGTPKYPKDFAHFDYVNPDAPKGGLVRLASEGGFDSFNPILDSVGTVAQGVGYLYETLTAASLDEPDIYAEYGLLAESLKYPADFSSVTFRLRPEAHWNDGQPITPEDVIWSFEQITKYNPNQRFYYSHVTKAEKTGDREVTFTFDAPNNRELPNIMGQLLVLPKHWWTGKDAQGQQRDIGKTTLEPPLGSGPYQIKSFEPNRYVIYERAPNYWGKDLNINVGVYNFDQIRFDEYRDTAVTIEAFKGDQYDWRDENSAKAWATQYNVPARQQGRMIVETFPDKARGTMQAFVLNLRLPKFQDVRVREALDLAFNFEAMKDTVFFGQYKRINSYFAGTDLASSGLPTGKELEILETVREKVPAEVFTTPYAEPVNPTPEAERDNLRKALGLLQEAGYQLRGRSLVDPETGQPFTIEMLARDSNDERLVLPYKQNLAKIGITLTLRIVDTPQFIQRIRGRDFEMTTLGWAESLSPGNEQRGYWGSKAADEANSRNYAGIKNEAVDTLIDRIIYAKDRDDLVAATRALDRVLLWNHYMIPQFYNDVFRTARWDRFGHPDNIPPYTTGFPDIWWYDADKAKKVAAR